VRVRWLSRVLVSLGAVFLFVGLLAGLANREVLDGNRFAGHVDAIRKDPAVARVAGVRITSELLKADPDLVLVRPLLESASASVFANPALKSVIRNSVIPLHRSLTSGSGGEPEVQLADVGALFAAAVTTVSPGAAARLPANLDVTLADFGASEGGVEPIRGVRVARVLRWLMPLAALLCLVGGGYANPSRRRGLRAVGIAVAATGITLGLATFVVSIVMSRIDTGSLDGALAVAAWHQLDSAFWTIAGLVAAAGYAIVATAVMLEHEGGRPGAVRIVEWLRRPDPSPGSLAAHGGLLVVVGLAAILRPTLALTVVAVVAGGLLVFWGAAEIVGVVLDRAHSGDGRSLAGLLRRTEVRVGLGVTVSLVLLIGLSVWNGRPGNEAIATTPVDTSACNGSPELCDRRYDQVSFPGTHNAMSAADEPGWFHAEQPTGLIGQLDAGIRVLLIDSWYGQRTNRPGLVTNIEGSRSKAIRQAEKIYGKSVVDSALRVRRALNLEAVGPARPYLCHELCELGSTLWEPVMAQVAGWMADHPRDVVTFFIQDEVSPADTAKVMRQAGLMKYVYTPTWGEPWPTLGQMIDSGKRLVFLMEKHDGGTAYPWLLQGFRWVQDTPYDNAGIGAFTTCPMLRGEPSSPLLLVNHWTNNFTARVSDARKANSAEVLGGHLQACEDERGLLPNYVAVNFYDQGDLFDVVDEINGIS
jgi:Short repeat of unknown function (DUF308)